MNATLRLTESGASTIYRLISPFIFIYICMKNIKQMKNAIIFFAVFVGYSLLVSIFYHHIDFSGYMFALYLLVEFVIIKYLAIKEKSFSMSFFSFLDINTMIIIVFGLIQYTVPYTMPHLQDRGHTITFYFWNENELSQAIACMAIIYLYRCFFEKERRDAVKAAIIFIIIYINDAKLSLLGLVFAFFCFFFYKLLCNPQNKVRMSGWVLVTLGTFLVFGIIAIILMLKIEFHFRDYTISLNELVGGGMKAIVTLQPLEGFGSETVRADAIIFGLQELFQSHFLGIGWENSIYMLEQPKYFLGTAKSMHNIVMQFLCEMGYFAIFCYAKLTILGLRAIKYMNSNRIFLLKIVFGLSFILISSQSSGAILSNYMTWAIVMYVTFLKDFTPDRGRLR
ncbi:MAG: hypothetical protein HFF79_08520 [Oscillospiraceae bacterium]|nr:hypothetical protein [Oscillospiraceae bacterium]